MVGNDSNGVAALKITKSDADNPATTPDSQRHKFLFSSNQQLFPAITDIITGEFRTTGGAWQYEPSGASHAASLKAFLSADFGGGYFYHLSQFAKGNYPHWRYSCPLAIWKYKDTSGRIINNIVRDYPRGVNNVGGRKFAGNVGDGSSGLATSTYVQGQQNDYSFTLWKGAEPNQNVDYYEESIVVFDLPGDHSAPIEAIPKSGNVKAIVIDDDTFEIAKPGYDVDSAGVAELAFSANRIFGGTIAAGDILVPANTTVYHDLGISVDASVVADVQFYENTSEYYYPASPAANIFGGRYYVSGSNLVIENLGVQCRARFMVHAKDGLPSTTGSNVPFNQFTDANGKEVVQLLRPGSAQPPNFADIYFDSRWPSIQVLAHGSIFPGNGNQQHVVNFENTGFLPFVAMSVIRGTGSQLKAHPPIVCVLRIDGTHAGCSTYAKINAAGNQVTIYTHVGNKADVWYAINQGIPYLVDRDEDNPVQSIKYYIFGIPN